MGVRASVGCEQGTHPWIRTERNLRRIFIPVDTNRHPQRSWTHRRTGREGCQDPFDSTVGGRSNPPTVTHSTPPVSPPTLGFKRCGSSDPFPSHTPCPTPLWALCGCEDTPRWGSVRTCVGVCPSVRARMCVRGSHGWVGAGCGGVYRSEGVWVEV